MFEFKKFSTVCVVFKFKMLFISLFQCSNISSLLRVPSMFKIHSVWLIRVRSISSKVVVFLGINLKEKLVVCPAGMYLGLIKWVFLLEDSPNSLSVEITLLTRLNSISSVLSSSPISLIWTSNAISPYFLSSSY